MLETELRGAYQSCKRIRREVPWRPAGSYDPELICPGPVPFQDIRSLGEPEVQARLRAADLLSRHPLKFVDLGLRCDIRVAEIQSPGQSLTILLIAHVRQNIKIRVILTLS
jgi:hypothetical protein